MTFVVSLLSMSFMCLGCAEQGPQLPRCYPVSGSVSINGEPAVRAVVRFHPQSPQDDGKEYGGSTFTNDDGTFQATTFTAGDGMPAGDYVVTIVANWVVREGMDVGVPDLLKWQYADPAKTPLKVTVNEEPLILDPYDLESK